MNGVGILALKQGLVSWIHERYRLIDFHVEYFSLVLPPFPITFLTFFQVITFKFNYIFRKKNIAIFSTQSSILFVRRSHDNAFF